MTKIEFLSFCEDPIKYTAERLLELKEQGIPLEKTALVFGGRRPGMFLNRELFRQHGSPLLSPVFFTMDEFASYIVCSKNPCSRIGDLDAEYFIYTLCRDKYPRLLKGDDSFASFLPWAREIKIFIEQLDLQDIPDKKLRSVEASAAIGYAVPEPVNELLENITGVRKEFEQFCFKERKLTRGLMYREAALGSRRELREPVKTVKDILSNFDFFVFSGFFYFHETELQIVKHVLDSGKAMMIFQGDPKEWGVLKKNLEILSNGIVVRPASSVVRESNNRPIVKLYCGQDSHAEAAMVRQVLDKVEDPENTLVVVPDPANLPVLLAAVSPMKADFNISLGYPLERTIVFPLFDSIFRAQENRKNNQYYTRDYLKIMTNPVVKNLSLGSARQQTATAEKSHSTVVRITTHKIAEALLGTVTSPVAGKLFVTLDEIVKQDEIFEQATAILSLKVEKEKLRQQVEFLHQALFLNWENVSTLAQLGEAVKKLLAVISEYSEFANYPFNVKAIDHALDLAETVSAASCSQEVFAQADVFRIFRQYLESAKVSFSGSPLKGLQILGMLETRSLTFKEVLITGLNEGTVPEIRQLEPLIPREIMLGLGINRLEKEEEIQRYLFRRVIGGAEKVHLFYREDNENERSRFLEQIIWEEQKKQGKLEVFVPQKGVFRVEPSLEIEEIPKTPDMVEYLRIFTYSPSSLDTYLNCPRQFYFRYVMNLQEKTDLLMSPEPREIGTFVHELLREAFTEFLNRQPVIDRTFEEKFFRLFKGMFEKDFKPRVGDGAFLLEAVLKHRLERFLQNERERQVAKLLVLEAPYNYNSGDFKLKAKVDRVDELADGTLLVVDYKTGGNIKLPAKLSRLKELSGNRQEMKKSIKSFQLPIYISIFRENQPGREVNACLYNLRETKLDICFKKESAAEKEEALSFIMAAAERLMKEISDSAVPFIADLTDNWQCESCAFKGICG